MDQAPRPIKRVRLKPSYGALLELGPWRPIPGCPGRLVLPGLNEASPADLLGSAVAVQRFEVDGAVDPIYVGRIAGGGLISYLKPDGRWVHTLNTEEGLVRKLAALGIEMPA